MKIKGIKIPREKASEKSETIAVPLPESVNIPMLHGLGDECTPTVKVGDRVLVGQKIGDGDNAVPVHSSVSGRVSLISDITLADGRVCKAVEIKTDGRQEVSPWVKPPIVRDRESFISAVRESGCVGLGGSGDVTYKKLSAAADLLIVNAVECEPYITSDYRCIIEDGDNAAEGIRLVMRYLSIDKAYVAVSSDKEEAVRILREKTANDENITVKPQRPRYPLGAEKVLAVNLSDKKIKLGEEPLEKGVLVLNISTLAFIGAYIKTGMPLVTRRVTVDGSIVKTPCSVSAPVGTSYRDLLEFAETNIDAAEKILSGGPMMGVCVGDVSYPLCKQCNAVTAFIKPLKDKKPTGLIVPAKETGCFRCGKCVEVCPMKLMPLKLERAFDKKDINALKRLNAQLCLNCGSCSYVCPAKRRIPEKNMQAQKLLADEA